LSKPGKIAEDSYHSHLRIRPFLTGSGTVELSLKAIIRSYSFAVIPSRGEIAATALQN
jgi:hypothetical protein